MKIIEQIKQKVTISDLLAYYQVGVRGRSFKCTHIYHDDKNPSAVISKDGGGYWCNGCGEGGNIIHLYQKGIRAGRLLDFQESIKQVQEDFNLDLDFNYKSDISTVENELYKVCCSPENLKIGTEYLASRGLKNTMQVGYMPLNLRFNDPETNKEYNLLKGRIIFPIRDMNGVLVGFSGRAAKWKKGDRFGKYQNTTRYKKESILHGLHLAKTSAIELGWIGLVEGYTDVIGGHLTKRMNLVSYSSATVTELQAMSLKSLTGIEFVVIFTDGDDASLAALKSNITNVMSAGLYPRIFYTPKGYDPCDFFLANKHTNILNEAKECWELLVYNEAWAGIANMKSIYRNMAISKMAMQLGDDKEVLLKMFNNYLRSKK